MFGFGKGKIEIQINKYNYSPGEVIEGKVTLKLKKPIRARELSISMTGEKRESQSYIKGGSYRTTSRTVKIFDFKQPLDGEKDYTSAEPLVYPFRIKIPPNILSQQAMPEGALGTAVKVAQALTGRTSRTKWYLVARLDVPKSIDVSKKVQINIA